METMTVMESAQLLINENIMEAAVEHLLYIVEGSIESNLVPLLKDNSQCIFPDLIRRIYEHARTYRTAINPLLQALGKLNWANDIEEAIQRIYKINLDLPYHCKVLKMAKDFYSQAYSICLKDNDAEELDTSSSLGEFYS